MRREAWQYRDLDELIPAVRQRPRARAGTSRRAPGEGQLALL
ncbi:MAG TPA: hypothetical protein VMU51_11185 [Mycobacteriales bacterium]|nr:hypothetical protein [Mycobacteriales bacterium]